MMVGGGPFDFIYENPTIKGILTSSRADITEVLKLAQMGKIQPVNSLVYGVDQLPNAVRKFQEGTVPGRIIADFNL